MRDRRKYQEVIDDLFALATNELEMIKIAKDLKRINEIYYGERAITSMYERMIERMKGRLNGRKSRK